jgi:hypothetical protein
MTTSTPQWLQTVQKKRELRDETIKKFSVPSSDRKSAIDNVAEIQRAIVAGEVTAVELCMAYITR